MSAGLRIFPTPFKGIYYVPSDEERDGWFIDRPLTILSRAVATFLEGEAFYYSCETAEEFFGLNWHPSGTVHVVNEKRSERIDLRERINRNKNKKTFRAKKIAKLLQYYGDRIIFHKTKNIKDVKIKQTPYGTFALKSQIKKDKKKFRHK